jgi:Holliday junction resolvasome RuvABC endonuclease subunit
MGIDASLSSTGICVAELSFLEDAKSSLLEVLLDENFEKELDFFEKSFTILHQEEVKEDKTTKKELAKTRKSIRDICKKGGYPSQKLISQEQKLVLEQSLYQIDVWEILYQKFDPVLIGIEDYSFSSYGSTTQLAELKGVFKQRFLKKYVPDKVQLRVAPITSVKKITSTHGQGNKELICQNMKRFGFEDYEKKDDMLDAIGISLSFFYAIWNLISPFEFPKPSNTKERNQFKSWQNCLNKFSQRLGTKDEVMTWIQNNQVKNS